MIKYAAMHTLRIDFPDIPSMNTVELSVEEVKRIMEEGIKEQFPDFRILEWEVEKVFINNKLVKAKFEVF